MMMMPVCSASSSQFQISFQAGLSPLSHLRKVVVNRGILRESFFGGLPNGSRSRAYYFKTQVTKLLNPHAIERAGVTGSTKVINSVPYSNELDGTELSLSNGLSGSVGTVNGAYPMGKGDLNYVEYSSISSPDNELLNIPGQITLSPNSLSASVPDTIPDVDARVDVAPENSVSVSDSLDAAGDALYKLKTRILELLSDVSASIDDSADNADRVVNDTLYAIRSSAEYTVKNVTEAIDNKVNNVLSTINHTGELAGSELTDFSGDLKEAMGKGGVVSVDLLRRTLVTLEDYLARGTTFVVYYYGSAKELLPPEVLNVLNTIEEKTREILRPVGSAFGQVYIAIEMLERNLGLDPNDPVLVFILLLGTSTALGITYRVLTYGGYSGDLNPKLALELLTAEENVVLIDVRPEELRERNGVPDLRRGARFKYGSVALPEIDGSVENLVRSKRDLNDALIATVIRNLKIVQDRSKVVVLDADGTRSKGIARSLKKLGVKKPYLVQGGFQSWVKSGLRVKELKPETPLTILNEEAEAILEEVKPTPVQAVGFGVGFIAAIYALFEWERTLQLIGIIGIAQTIYRRVASYEDSEDFKQDVRLLLGPARLGAQAFSWAAGKLEPSRIGLPTSPSSSDVQNRVLLAAAKHESQPPSDTEESQDLSPESVSGQ